MATNKTPTTNRGFFFMDPRLRDPSCLWAAQSSYTQSGPRAGDAEPQQATDLEIETSGTMTAGATLELLALRGGMPGTGSARAGIVWRSTGLYRGWEVPSIPMAWEAVEWCDGAGDPAVWSTEDPHSVTLPSGVVLTACQAHSRIAGTDYYGVRVESRSTGGSWSAVTALSTTVAPHADGYHPCLVLLPNGRVLCFHWVFDIVANEAQVRMAFSDDEGATWAEGAPYTLASAIDVSGVPGVGAAGYEVGRLRAAYYGGQIVLTASLVANNTTPLYRATLAQWVSADLGHNFQLVNAGWAVASIGAGYQEVLAVNKGFLLIYISAVTLFPYCRRINTGSEDLESATAVQLTGATEVWASLDGANQYFTDGDLAACLDDDGAIYAYGRQPTSSMEGIVLRSIDDGATWGGMGHGSTTAGLTVWWRSDDTSTYPRNLTATCQRGRVLIAHNWAANPGNEDDSLGCLYLGGYTTVTMPQWTEFATDLDRVGLEHHWFPIEVPSDCGWLAGGAVGMTLAAGAGGIVTVAQDGYYSRNPVGSIAEGFIVRLAFKCQSGGSLTAPDCGARIRLADGVDDYEVEIRASSAGFRVYDTNGAALVGSSVTLDMTAGVEILVGMSTARVDVWYRARDASEDHVWIVGPAGALVDDAATPNANNLLRWGHVSNGTAESRWYELHYTSDEWTGDGLAGGQTNPDDLWARTISATAEYIADGVSIRAIDGPAYLGDEWDIATRYDYGIERIFPSVAVSPRIGWRSTSDAAQTIALALDETLLGTVESAPGNDILCLGLFGINFPTCTLEGYDVDTTAWVAIATVAANSGLTGLHWTRRGNAIVPTGTAGTNNPYLFHSEFQGGHFRPDTVAKVRPILAHTEGRIGPGTCKLATILLSDVDGTEGASGTAGAIWAPNVVVAVKLNGARYAGYRLSIPNTTTYEGYKRIGSMVLGWLTVLGTEYSWGRVIATEAGAERREARDRTSKARVVAPPRRTVEFGWVDGVDSSDAFADDTPDYLLGSSGGGAEPVASEADVLQVLEGALRLCDGERHPIAYLPAIPVAGSTITLNRRHQAIYGTATGRISIETVLGEEGSTELARMPTLTLIEEV